MENNSFFKALLKMNNSFIFTVNSNTKTISNVYQREIHIGDSLSFDDACKLFCRAYNLKPIFYDKFIRFLTNLNPTEEKFTLNLDYERTDGSVANIDFTGLRIDNDNILITIKENNERESELIDDLTKAHSKRFIVDKTNEAINSNRQFALLLIDIDDFDLINKRFGHSIGDIILIEAAAIIKKQIGNNGFVSRVGGDEFLVIMYIDDDYDKIHEATRVIRKAISALSESNIKNITITATVGVVSYPTDGVNYDILSKKLYKALARGKAKGKNCFIIYDPAKSGVVDEDDLSVGKKMDTSFKAVNNYNIVLGAIDILNRENKLENNIRDTLSLVGNYFMLDRIKVVLINPDTDSIVKIMSWHNPISKVYELSTNAVRKDEWRAILKESHECKINQVLANQKLPIYDQLVSEHVTAFFNCEMFFDKKIFGSIRYDMCENDRFWKETDISSLRLITKALAIKLNRVYMEYNHYNELFYDGLTGIYNYPKWRSEASIFVNNNIDVSYSIFVFDIKNFTSVSNLIGSKEADKILILIANRLRNLKKGEIYARISGDRFIVLLPFIDNDYIKNVFNDIKNAIVSSDESKLRTIVLHGGIYNAAGGSDVLSAIDKAMLALRTNIINDDLVIFTDEIDKEIKEQTLLELHMDKALEDNEFLLFLQPKIDAKTGKLASAEALTRWNYKFEKIIPPFKFIPLFEQNGFITKLDYRVFENVCRFQRRVLDSNKTPVPISVNVSRYTSDYEAYIRRLREIREKYNIPTELIEIEITEGMYIDNVNDVEQFVKLLKKEGYNISIDDFGSGYSNLINITKLDFEVLKLDKTLCSSLDEKTELVVDAIISTAKKSGHSIVCEGVETEEIYKKFRELGADYIQGYYFDKPLIEDEFFKKYIDL